MMKERIKRGCALLLSLLLCGAPLALAADAAQNTARTLHIASASEFKKFAKDCTTNTYSQGLTVLLDRDIDLSGFGSISVPVFCGTFDGGHHTIRGYSCEGKGSDRGLFRYIKTGATVHNLTVSGTVEPEGTKSGLGMIAGRNEGTIRACAAEGVVTGDESVGGIVGVNEASGILRDCVSRVMVTANTNAGGIAGRSEGTISGCVNEGDVNIDSEKASTNTGGITGRSEGVIDGCVNRGTIGYQHIGYNTGGIVGIQNGSVVQCTNEGKIYGRKDVGGIVGQFEPYIDLHYGTSPIDTLDSALDSLSGLLQQMADQVSGAAGDLVDDFQVMNEAMSSIRDTAHSAGSEGRVDAEAMLTDVHGAAQTVNTALAGLIDDTDDYITQTNKTLDKVNKQMKKLRKNLMDVPNTIGGTVNSANDAVSETTDSVTDRVNDVMDELDGAKSDLRRLQDFVREAADILNSDNPDVEALKEALDQLGDVDPSARLSRAVKAVDQIKEELNLLVDNLHWGISQSRDQVQSALEDANDALIQIEKLSSTLNADTKSFSDTVLSRMRTVNTQVDAIENTVRGYTHTLGEKGQDTMDKVNDQLHVINDQVGKLADGAGTTNTDLHATTSAIITQLNTVEDAIKDMVKTPEKTVDDISDSAGESGPGRVYSCKNAGAIEADANVGGIAGMVAPELEIDPEEDVDLQADNLLVDTTAFVKATLRDCRNDGNVTAKNECAGGILGRAEVGAVIGCVSKCAVETTSGGKAGGIAGLSDAIIKQCAAQVDLTGGDNLGGIAGEGSDISNCRAMTRIDSDGEKLGAIAGAAGGTVQGNYFLNEDYAGVDGINYDGQCNPVSFETFATLSGVPADFLTFTVTFEANGVTVASYPVAYGAALPEDQIPEVPKVGSEYGEWEDFHLEEIIRSLTVHAVYSNLRSTVASPGAHPVLLAESAFSPNASVDVVEWTPDADQIPSGYVLVSAFTYTVRDDTPVAETVSLRAHAGEDGKAVAILKDGKLQITASESDGSYLVFEGVANGAFAVLQRDYTTIYLVCGVIAGLILLLTAAWILRRRRKKRTEPAADVKPQEQTEQETVSADE